MRDGLESETEKRFQLWEATTRDSRWASAARDWVPPELMPVLKELARPARQSDMPWRIELCQHGLRRMKRGQNPWLWAALQDALATSLAQSPSGERAENLERAIEHYHRALEVRTRQAVYTVGHYQNNLPMPTSARYGRAGGQPERAIEHYHWRWRCIRRHSRQ